MVVLRGEAAQRIQQRFLLWNLASLFSHCLLIFFTGSPKILKLWNSKYYLSFALAAYQLFHLWRPRESPGGSHSDSELLWELRTLPGQNELKLEHQGAVVARVESRVDDVLKVRLEPHGRSELLRVNVSMTYSFW